MADSALQRPGFGVLDSALVPRPKIFESNPIGIGSNLKMSRIKEKCDKGFQKNKKWNFCERG